MKKLIFIFFLCVCIFLSAIEFDKKPMKSAFLSLAIPGGGQFYNEKYLKSGLYFSVESFIIGLTVYHHVEANRYYDRYKKSLNESDYNQYLDYYYDTQNDYWWLGTCIVLSMIDAYVDAHLYNYTDKRNKVRLKFEANKLLFHYSF